MNRSLLIRVASPLMLPLMLALGGCSEPGGGGGTASDETSGIATLSMGDGDGDGDGPGDGDGEGPGDGDGDSGGMDCGEVSIVPEYTPPNVMLVVDASGSMYNFSWDHDLDPNTPDETRWATLHRVVETITTEFGPAMRSGVKRFPSEGASGQYGAPACFTTPNPEVGVALDNGAAILAALPEADAQVFGGTPSTRGMDGAINHLVAQSAVNPRYILFITDGAANCTPDGATPFELMEVYDETLEPTVAAAYNDQSITTFAIGIDIINELLGVSPQDGTPEANPFERLNDIALAGGAARDGAEKFYNATNQDELLAALAEIMDTITECIIDLSMTDQGVPLESQLPYIEFTADGVELEQVEDCENEDGWAWIEEGVIMTFCGSYCDDFKNGGVTFDGIYGCPPLG